MTQKFYYIITILGNIALCFCNSGSDSGGNIGISHTVKRSFSKFKKLSGGAVPDTGYPGYPINTFPGTKWAWEKAPPKFSLNEVGPKSQAGTAASWILNIIEAIHWASFPLGFYIAYFLFTRSDDIAKSPALGGNPSRVFFLLLSLLCQVFGGVGPVIMHIYEDWQVAPFRNILNIDDYIKNNKINFLRVPQYNNAWLRAIAYQVLFTFQSLGFIFFGIGAFGLNTWTKTLLAVTVAVALLGPKTPLFIYNRKIQIQPQVFENRPIFPLPLSLLVMVVVNIIVYLFAAIKIFSPAFTNILPSIPFLSKLPTTVRTTILALIGPGLLAAGGAIEGYFAESTFNQWLHLLAFLILNTGLATVGLYYKILADTKF